MVVLHQRLPLRRCDSDIEQIWIEGRRRSQRDHVPGCNIHHDRGRALGPQSLGDEPLHIVVDGEVNVCTGRSWFPAELANHAAIGVHFDAADSRLAANLCLEFLFDAALPNAKAGQREQRIRIVVLILFRHRTDIAKDMRQLIPERIGARLAHIGLNTGEIGQMQIDAREIVPGEVLGHNQGHETLAAACVLKNARALAVGQIDDAADGIERGCDAPLDLLRNQ